jgi:hypothetical protein
VEARTSDLLAINARLEEELEGVKLKLGKLKAEREGGE